MLRKFSTTAIVIVLACVTTAIPVSAEEQTDENTDANIDSSDGVLSAIANNPEVQAIIEPDKPEQSNITVEGNIVSVENEEIEVELTADSVGTELDDGTSFALEMPSSDDTTINADGTIIVENTHADTDLVVTPQQDAGARITAVIDGNDAPKTFDFPIGTGEVKLKSDGSAAVVDVDDLIMAEIEKPWAFDNEGAPVNTRYTTDGSTLTLHVDHEGASYPVVADPRVDWGISTGTAYFNKLETETISFVGINALPGLFFVPPPFNGILASYAASITGWATTAVALDKCLKLKFGFTFSFTGPPSPGITPGHHTGSDCY